MFDISTVSKRYFEIKLSYTDESGQPHKAELEVEPPKVKTLSKIITLSKVHDDDPEENVMENMTTAIQLLLSKNKTGYKVPVEYISDLDYDQMEEICTAFFKWLNHNRELKN